MQNKKGFTLIELMVVVVIIGILAAVAVPKLFGMIAKSKASEIGPAAGTYVKLQNAYVAEAGTMVGNWLKIGYIGPGTKVGTAGNESASTNFTYSGTTMTTDTVLLSSSLSLVGWTAKNIAKLNDCAAASSWLLTMKSSGVDAGALTYDPTTTDKPNCEVLTPSFKNIK